MPEFADVGSPLGGPLTAAFPRLAACGSATCLRFALNMVVAKPIYAQASLPHSLSLSLLSGQSGHVEPARHQAIRDAASTTLNLNFAASGSVVDSCLSQTRLEQSHSWRDAQIDDGRLQNRAVSTGGLQKKEI